MTPTLRIAAPTPSQVGDVRPALSAGDPANTFDASFAAALKARPVTRDAGSADRQAGGSGGEAATTQGTSAGTATTGTTPVDGDVEAAATAPEGTSEESAPAAVPAAPPFTLLNALVNACTPTGSTDGPAATAATEPLSTAAPAVTVGGTVAANLTAAGLVPAPGEGGLPVGQPASLAAPAVPGVPSTAAIGDGIPVGTAPSAQPATQPSPAATTGPATADAYAAAPTAPAPAQPAAATPTPAAAGLPLAEPAPVDATVAALATAAVTAPGSTAPTDATTPLDATVPSAAPVAAAPTPAGSLTADTSADLAGGGQPAAPAIAADANETTAAPLPAGGAVTVVPADGASVAAAPVADGPVVDEPTAVAYGVPGTDALKRAVALADAVDATSVDVTTTAVPSSDDGRAAAPTGGGALPQPAAPAAPRDVPVAVPTVTAAAPTTPVATATPTQQSTLPGSVPPPHQQVATAVSPMLRRADGSYSVNINLEPEHLGRVSLQVHIRGGEVAVTMQAADAGARELLRDNLGQLRQQLEQQGVKAGQLDVRDDSAFARQFESPQGERRSADSAVSGQRASGAGSDEPTSPDSALPESIVGQPDDTGALDLHL